MKGKSLVIVFFIFLLLAGVYFVSKNNVPNSSINLGMPAPNSTNVPEMIVGEQSGGMYIEEYSEDLLDIYAGQRTVLFFYANWCPTCKPVDEELKQNANLLPRDVVVIRVNYNDDSVDEIEKALAEKYNITYQHTFVLIDQNGKEIKKWVGRGLDEINSQLE